MAITRVLRRRTRGQIHRTGKDNPALRTALSAVLMCAPADAIERSEWLLDRLAEGRTSGLYGAALAELRLHEQAVAESSEYDNPLLAG